MISLYRRGKVWWAQASFNGAQRRWSLKTRDKSVAESLRRQAEINKLGGGRLGDKTWTEFHDEFIAWIAPQIKPKTFKGYSFSLKKLSEFLATRSVANVCDVSPAIITAFIEWKRKQLHPSRRRPMTDGGVKFYLRALHRVFAYAEECQYISSNPVRARNLDATPGKTQPFSREEIDKMLTAPYLEQKPYLRALVLTFLHTGLRLGDVRDLEKADVAGDRSVIRTRKRGKDIILHIHKDLRASLRAHFAAMNPAQRKSPLLFPAENGVPMMSMDKHLRRLFVRQGITNGHAHRFRDTFSVNLLAAGASLYDVSKLLGVSMQTTERHYSPYCLELQERGARLISKLDYSAKPTVLNLCSTLRHSDQLSTSYETARDKRNKRSMAAKTA